jgi:hypothetical protein
LEVVDFQFTAANIYNFLEDGSNRGLVMSSQDLAALKYKSFYQFRFSQLGEKLATDTSGFWFRSSDFIIESFNDLVVRLVESGISQKLMKSESKALASKRDWEREEEKILLLEHLTTWIYIFLVLLLIASVVFSAELFMGRILRQGNSNSKSQAKKKSKNIRKNRTGKLKNNPKV